jgi:dTDP-4-amino-4,6-dideoxygalactose transaminase
VRKRAGGRGLSGPSGGVQEETTVLGVPCLTLRENTERPVPVFVDVERATYNLGPDLVEAAVTPRTKAIIPVHLYGQCADMDPLMEIEDRHGLVIIEDACQSIWSEYKGKRAGALVSLREHGQRDRYFHATVGINSRLDARQAAVLLVKLKRLDAWSDGRSRNAEHYNRRFAGSAVGTPHREPRCRHIYNQYMIRGRERDALEAHLKGKGIGCALYYPLPLHLQECFRYLGYKVGGLPESEAAARETISIPVFTELAEEELGYVATPILDFCGRG